MVRVARTGLFLACALVCAGLSFGCVPRNAIVEVPTLEVSVNPASGRALETSDPDPREDGRAVGDFVDVEWRGSWWPATLLERRGARWLVHYEGYGSDWDEVVAIVRIRDRGQRLPEMPIEPMDEDVDP